MLKACRVGMMVESVVTLGCVVDGRVCDYEGMACGHQGYSV